VWAISDGRSQHIDVLSQLLLAKGVQMAGTSAGSPITRRDHKPTLASQGIDKNLAHQARRLGAMGLNARCGSHLRQLGI
jgi:hypothetical protein